MNPDSLSIRHGVLDIDGQPVEFVEVWIGRLGPFRKIVDDAMTAAMVGAEVQQWFADHVGAEFERGEEPGQDEPWKG